MLVAACHPPVDPVNESGADEVIVIETQMPNVYIPAIYNDGNGFGGGWGYIYFPGEYTTIPSRQSVPFYSQVNPKWASLRMEGKCTCTRIGDCGCALTSVAMVFSYLGVSYNPKTLNECMRSFACPLNWEGAAIRCGDNRIKFVKRLGFTWERLNKFVGDRKEVVILGLHRYNYAQTHFVVVTKGSGLKASGYTIHDPEYTWGKNDNLAWRINDGWKPYAIIIYRYEEPVIYPVGPEWAETGSRGWVGRRFEVDNMDRGM